MNISDKGLALIKSFEQFRAEAYLDAVGVPTIGWGTTHINGQPVKLGMSCTMEQATQWMLADLAEFENFIQDKVNVPLTQNQFDALCSLVYNIGDENFEESSVLREINQKDYKTAQARFLLWNKAGGKVLRGLSRRRVAEAAMFGPLTADELVQTYHIAV
jgi:lysozyme